VKSISVALLAGLAFASVPRPAHADTVLDPTSAWVVDYADDSCALRRTFGTPEQSALLQMRQFKPDGDPAFTIVTKGIRPLMWETSTLITAKTLPLPWVKTVKVALQDGEADRRIERARPISTGDGFEGYLFSMPFAPDTGNDGQSAAPRPDVAAQRAWEQSVTDITLKGGFNKTFTLKTGSMQRPMDALRQCMDELLTHWGIDVAAHKTLTRKVEAVDQIKWARKLQELYPPTMLEEMENGVVRIRMGVDQEGKPSACHVQLKSKDDTFERTACPILMRHARFLPALDKDGRSIASYYIVSVHYMVN